MNTRRQYISCFLVLFILTIETGCKDPSGALLTLTGTTMGTTWTVKTNGSVSLPITSEDVRKNIDALLEKINHEMSTYRPDSILSGINNTLSTDWQAITPDLLDVIDTAIKVSLITEGAFDITVGPLVNLWGFGPVDHSEEIPADADIAGLLKETGFHYIQLQSHPPLIKKERPDLYLDLSGIAKGFAVDKIAAYLEQLGIDSYMVEIGGEIRAHGLNPLGQPWHIGIEKPLLDGRDVQHIIELDNIGMATSGDYRNYFERDGQRYSHTIDPVSGRPVTHSLASVTVLHKSTMFADAMATALLVLGPERGYALAQRENLAAFFIIRKDDIFIERYTPAFKLYFPDQ